MSENPPRENLIRGVMPGLELREAETGAPKLFGHFARFNEWTEINSAWEGRFMERIAPGAFSKTIAENRNGMRVLFDHGHDPSIGNKPLGTISDLREDGEGASYEVDLFDTEYVRELLPPLKAGALGASFRFKVMREDFNKKPERSDSNPDQLPERTIVEAKVMEFGPVTFPAYDGATAGVRSMTDEYIAQTIFGDAERARQFTEHYIKNYAKPTTITVKSILDGLEITEEVREKIRERFAAVREELDNAPSTDAAAKGTSAKERREEKENRFKNREEYLKWLTKS